MGNQAGLAILFIAGAVTLMATATAQTPDNVKIWLENNGYSNAAVQGPNGSCGKGSSKFSFRARSVSGAPVSGELCAGPYQAFYRVRLSS